VGVSTYPAFTANEKCWLSLAVLSEEVPLGSEVTVVWGEPDGGSKKPVVERHAQRQIRATVHPWPYARQARQAYRPPVGAAR
jgi:vanillate/3-O-methylgallate O-demethylase